MRYRVISLGFTLIEIAIVLVIAGLLIGSLLGPLSVRIEQQERLKTQALLEEIKEALYGYAATTGTLPCPDTDGDGLPNDTPPTPPCDQIEDRLPWQTLGVERGDAWGYQFRYRVTPEFTAPNTATCDDDGDGNPNNGDDNFDLCDVGDITVRTHANNKTTLIDLVTTAPAVIISHGKNGLGAIRIDGGAMPPTAGGTDENVNADSTEKRFITRTYSFPSTNCDDTDPALDYCQFDDLVVWISPNILKNRMIAAGRLP